MKSESNGHVESGREDKDKVESHPKTASKAFELLLHKVGDYNRYQWKLLCITGFCGFFTAFHNIGAVLLAATPDHWCSINYFQSYDIPLRPDYLNLTTPWVIGKTGKPELSQCSYFDSDYENIFRNRLKFSENGSLILPQIDDFSSYENGSIVKCNSWIYDTGTFKETVVSEWNLVCDKRWLMSSIQATYMLGILTGAVLFSAVSDKIGRRLSSLICVCLFIVSSIGAAFAQTLTGFMVLRFVIAASGQGVFLIVYILLMETVSLHGRNVMGNLFHMGFSLGFMSLSFIGYFVKDWRHLQLAISLPGILLLVYYWVLPESARWLLMHHRTKEGVEVLRQIAKCNGRAFLPDEELVPYLNIIEKEIETHPKLTPKEKCKSVLHDMMSLLKTTKMRQRNMVMFYTWFVTSMVYYGLSFSGANLSANLYLSLTLSASIEIPAILFSILFIARFGRRLILCGSFFIGGISCIAIAFVPTEMTEFNLFLACVGKYCISTTFLIVFIYSAELVPTNVRNIAIGMASMWARIGSGIAPYIVDLLGDIYYYIPSTIFGCLAVIAALLSALLPETGKKRLPESIHEIENMRR